MRIVIKSRAGRALTVLIASWSLQSCTLTNPPRAAKQFFLPPARSLAPPAEPVLDPPALPNIFYANEMPAMVSPLPPLPRPTDAEFLIKKADDSFLEGKKALEAGRDNDARMKFDKAIEALLSAPDNLPDRSRVERRLEELVEAIYRYDADQTGDSDKVVYDKRPMDDMVEMIFSPDAGSRSKFADLIRSTTSQLPLQQHDVVIGAMNFFSSERGKRIIEAGLRRQAKYKPMIERILAEEGVPQELIFLAQAESGYMPRAMSNKLCVGLWQFSKATGREYGLTQTAATDDRMDPEKATRAAAKHLKDLYEHFGDWYLAMAAYDCGPACVDHAVARTGYADFFELRRLNVLPKETANYVPVILAMTIIGKNAQQYGLDHLDLESPLETDSIDLQGPTHLALIADAVDRPLSELKELNPALLKSVAPAGFRIHIPKGSLASVETAFSVVPPSKRDSWRVHRLALGDTFAALAKRYSAPTSAVSQANHGELPEAGSLVAIPVAYPGDRTAAKRATSAKRRTAPASIAASAQKPKSAPKTASKTLAKKVAPSAHAAAPKAPGKPTVNHSAALRTPNS
ncbi:MAG TPA: transglycosylase SLT domain-containing protein [Bryobacteraceae bacterium]|nr:transglycosylase SLT domain-containing protein [Bryobacteraceae bacterium]